MRRLNALLPVAAIVVLALTACAEPAPVEPVGAQIDPEPAIQPIIPVVAPSVERATPEPDAAFAQTGNGVVLPDPERTPGAVYDDVEAADICELHYTQGVRQPRFNTKVEALAAYGVSTSERDVYRVDHLVPISLGGNNEIANLWPQPYDGVAGANEKDLLERHLRGMVCSNLITLPEAQRAIATDWWAAYQTLMGIAVEPGSEGLEPWTPHVPAEGEVVNGGPCDVEGEVGYTVPKRVPLTCLRTSDGTLEWQKRS